MGTLELRGFIVKIQEEGVDLSKITPTLAFDSRDVSALRQLYEAASNPQIFETLLESDHIRLFLSRHTIGEIENLLRLEQFQTASAQR